MDDDYNMHLALMDFGKDLGSLSEITVRYLLCTHDNYEDPEGTYSSFYILWRMLCGGSLRPQLIKLGFSCDPARENMIEKKDLRDRMSNLPKHQAALANSKDWQSFLAVYEELRRLIRNYVVNERTAPLEALYSKTGNSEDEEWSYLFDTARGFHGNSGYKYILITDRPRCGNVLDLFKIPWSVVLDFDADTDQPDGLYYEFQHAKTDTLVEWNNMSDRVQNNSTVIHWVNVAIRDENGEPYADKALARKASKKLRSFIESYHRMNPEPVMVVVSMSNEDYSRTLKSTANVIYDLYENDNAPDKSDVKFFVLQKSSVELILEDEQLLQTFNLGISQLISGAQKEIVDKPVFTGKYLMPAKLEGGIVQAEMDVEQCLRLRQYAEPLFFGIEQEENEGT